MKRSSDSFAFDLWFIFSRFGVVWSIKCFGKKKKKKKSYTEANDKKFNMLRSFSVTHDSISVFWFCFFSLTNQQIYIPRLKRNILLV